MSILSRIAINMKSLYSSILKYLKKESMYDTEKIKRMREALNRDFIKRDESKPVKNNVERKLINDLFE